MNDCGRAMGTVGRGWQVFLVALMVAAFVVVSASAAHAVTVTFTDPMLEAAVRLSPLVPDQPFPITDADMRLLTSVEAAGAGITDLNGLEYATSLTELRVNHNQISDISPLSGLTFLTDLYLHYNQISDISPLSGLASLGTLNLESNSISDISPLSGLTSLGTLNLAGNPISDISPLSGLTSLGTLYLAYNQISDISPLSGLTSLTELRVNHNQISDISPLSGLTFLTDLYLHDNQISDISPLSGLASLTGLALGQNRISDISPLSGLTSMEGLGLQDNQISDISPLSGLTSLGGLGLEDNQISDISPLVANAGIGYPDIVHIERNYLDLLPGSQAMSDINALLARGIGVLIYEPQNVAATPSTRVGIQANKAEAYPGDTITWTITETNDGDVPLTDVYVGLSFSGISGGPSRVEWGPGQSGDIDNDGILDPDETWSWQITNSVQSSWSDKVSGGAYGHGIDPLGNDITYPSDPDERDVDFVNVPHDASTRVGIDADKAEAYPGDTITWTITETNDGDVPLTDVYVGLSFSGISGGPSRVEWGPGQSGDIDNDGILDPDETWSWQITNSVQSSWSDKVSGGAYGHGIDPLGNDITYPSDPDERDVDFVAVVDTGPVLVQLDPAASGSIRYFPEMGILEQAPVGDLMASDYFRTTPLNRTFRRGFAEFAIPDDLGAVTEATLVLTEWRATITDPVPPDVHELTSYPADLIVDTADFGRPSTPIATFETDANEPTGVFSFDVTHLVAASAGNSLGFGVKMAVDPAHDALGIAGSGFGAARLEIASDPTAQPISIPDPGLEAAIRVALGKPVGVITDTDMESLTQLSADGRGIEDLSGLEYATQLQELNLQDNAIADLAPIEGHPKLRVLNLDRNGLLDADLGDMRALEILSLDGNELTSWSPPIWGSVPPLRELHLADNQIESFWDLRWSSIMWDGLRYLDVSSNKITDLGPVVGLLDFDAFRLRYFDVSLNYLDIEGRAAYSPDDDDIADLALRMATLWPDSQFVYSPQRPDTVEPSIGPASFGWLTSSGHFHVVDQSRVIDGGYGVASFELSFDGALWLPAQSFHSGADVRDAWWFEWSEYDSVVQPYTLYLRATDAAGNVATTSTQIRWNQTPVCGADDVVCFENTRMRYPKSLFLSNDEDDDGQGNLTLLDVAVPPAGTPWEVWVEGDEIVFDPEPGYYGPAEFTYIVEDIRGYKALGTVNVDVLEVGENDTPVSPGSYTEVSINDVSVGFQEVGSFGVVNVTPTEPTADDPPSGFRYGNDAYAYYDISTTADFTGNVTIRVNYGDALDDTGLRLFHWDADGWTDQFGVEHGPGWRDITLWVDTAANTILGVTDSFSPFALFTPNSAPVADANGPYLAVEGAPVALDGTGSFDPDGDSVEFAWDLDADGEFDEATSETPAWTFADNGSFPVGLEVTDAFGMRGTASTVAQIANVPPSAGPIATAAEPVAVGTEITAQVDFTDPGVFDTHTVSWDWGDGTTTTGTVIEVAGSGTAYGTHAYATPGVYTVTAHVTDKDGDSDTAVFEYVVAYDPSAGFVTGGGWIASPAGSYVPEPTLEGKATFGFVSRYKKGAKVPDGSTQFQFKAGDLNFHSDTQQWLVVNQKDKNAQFKCSGTINGEFAPGSDPFDGMIWAGDGDGPEGQDTFRIKLWYTGADGSEVVVYDNLAHQPIGGGSIVVHAKK